VVCRCKSAPPWAVAGQWGPEALLFGGPSNRGNINRGSIGNHPPPFHKNSMMGNSISLCPGKWKQVPRNDEVLPKSISCPTGSGKPFPFAIDPVPRNKQVSFHIFVPHATCTTSWPSPRPLDTRAGTHVYCETYYSTRVEVERVCVILTKPFCVSKLFFAS